MDNQQRNKRHLTKTILDNLKTKGSREYRVWDDDVGGLFVAVYPSGKRVFFFMYGSERRRRQFSIGTYGNGWTLDQARAKAHEYLTLVAKGHDPLDEKRKVRATKALLFRDWVKTYLEAISSRKKSWKKDETFLLWAVGQIGTKPLAEVEVEDVAHLVALVREKGIIAPPSLLRTLRAQKSSEVARRRWKGKAPYNTAANRFRASLRTCLEDARKRGDIASNPAADVDPYPENEPRQRVLSETELGLVLKEVGNIGDPFVRLAFNMLFESGARSSEVLRAKWGDFDLEAGVWRIPRPKSGRSGEAIPLSSNLVAMLGKATRMEGNPYIIPGRKPGAPRTDLKGPWNTILEAAGVSGVTLHDIRRTLGAALARKAGIHVASKVLRHSSIAVTARIYAPLAAEVLREAVDAVSEERGKVLPMRKKGEGA